MAGLFLRSKRLFFLWCVIYRLSGERLSNGIFVQKLCVREKKAEKNEKKHRKFAYMKKKQ